MKKMLMGIMGMMGVMGVLGQTPNTNDVARAVNPGLLNYSTNQNAGMVWMYRQVTNSLPITSTNLVGKDMVVKTNAPPTYGEWHTALIRGVAGAIADDYYRQRGEAEEAVKTFQDLRAKWAELTPAQRAAVMQAAGL
jgi:hypothetical protein